MKLKTLKRTFKKYGPNLNINFKKITVDGSSHDVIENFSLSPPNNTSNDSEKNSNFNNISKLELLNNTNEIFNLIIHIDSYSKILRLWVVIPECYFNLCIPGVLTTTNSIYNAIIFIYVINNFCIYYKNKI
jgi:hypothetical protein